MSLTLQATCWRLMFLPYMIFICIDIPCVVSAVASCFLFCWISSSPFVCRWNSTTARFLCLTWNSTTARFLCLTLGLCGLGCPWDTALRSIILCFFLPFQPFMLNAFFQDLVVTATSSGIGPYLWISRGISKHISNLETAAENVLPIVSQSLDFVIVPRNDHTSACNDQWSRENGRSEPAKLSACRRSDWPNNLFGDSVCCLPSSLVKEHFFGKYFIRELHAGSEARDAVQSSLW